MATSHDDLVTRMIDRYGPLMTTEDLAEVLRRKKESIAVEISRANHGRGSAWAKRILDARSEVSGQRSLYLTHKVAAVIDTVSASADRQDLAVVENTGNAKQAG